MFDESIALFFLQIDIVLYTLTRLPNLSIAKLGSKLVRYSTAFLSGSLLAAAQLMWFKFAERTFHRRRGGAPESCPHAINSDPRQR